MRACCPCRAQFAVMLDPAAAKQVGLVDAVVPTPQLLGAAEAAMQRMLKFPDFSRAVSSLRAVRSGCCPGARRRIPSLPAHAAAAAPPRCAQETKRLLREEFCKEWVTYADPEAAYAWDMLASPAVTQQLGAVLQRLSGGGKKQPGGAQSKL